MDKELLIFMLNSIKYTTISESMLLALIMLFDSTQEEGALSLVKAAVTIEIFLNSIKNDFLLIIIRWFYNII